ncbi:MAG: hypothetical protein KDD99_30390, partial [Bacteroidetes bacterium]|nr:hypothetical protein [Bacteroidota bacterium]
MKKNLLIHTFSEIYLLLDGKQKKGILLLFLGIMVSGILDLVGLAAILGVIGLAVSPEIIFENEWVNGVYESLGYTDTTGFIILVISAMLVLFVFKVIVGMGIIYQQKTYIFDLTQDIIRRMYVYYFSKNYAFVRKIDSGNLITNIHNIPSHFVMDILEPATMLLSETFVALSIVVVIAAIDFKLLVFLGIIMGTAFGLIYWSLRNRVYQLGMKKKVIAPEAIRLINESILGYIPIKLFDRISFFSTNYMKVQNEEYTVRKWISFFNEIPMKINEVLMVSGIFLVFLYGLLFLDDQENFLIMMGTLAVSAYRVMPSLNRILKSLVNIKRSQYLLDILSVLKGFSIEHDKEV